MIELILFMGSFVLILYAIGRGILLYYDLLAFKHRDQVLLQNVIRDEFYPPELIAHIERKQSNRSCRTASFFKKLSIDIKNLVDRCRMCGRSSALKCNTQRNT